MKKLIFWVIFFSFLFGWVSCNSSSWKQIPRKEAHAIASLLSTGNSALVLFGFHEGKPVAVMLLKKNRKVRYYLNLEDDFGLNFEKRGKEAKE